MANKDDMTQTILSWFERISQIPRESKHEAAIATALSAWAKEYKFVTRQDAVGNLVIEVPGSAGYERSPTVVIQGHMDMVCEKAKGSEHDFRKDPIKLVVEGEWLHADGTTLGADNGIALAMAFVAATEADLPHPPLELLFTVEEETGLTGANAISADFVKGKILLNVDSEDEGVFTVGCAGGQDTHISLPIEIEAAPANYQALGLVVEGFRGGHSGVDIHQQRGNAVRTLARGLRDLLELSDLRLASLHGGTAHNAIPRDAEAVFFLPTEDLQKANDAITRLDAALKMEFAKSDPKASVKISDDAQSDRSAAWSKACTQRAIWLGLALPDGVASFSQDIKGLVETSNNLATLRTEEGVITYLTSQRSSVMDRLHLLTHRIEAVASLCPGAKATSNEGYPAWQPNMDSPLLERCKRLYQELYAKEPVVEIIHAGLECGIIGDRCAGMDMISFGPTIQSPHSPDERIELASIGLVWDFMAALLKSLK